MNQKNTHEFRSRLQEELVSRMKANPRYSLRAFARHLGVDPSSLSQYFRRKRHISLKQVEKFSLKLGFEPEEIHSFKSEAAASKMPSENVWQESNRDLTLDAFQIIADWYHYAIFELVTLKDFKQDSKWIARKLGIHGTEVDLALERLFRTGLLTKDKKGKWRQGTLNASTTGNPFTAVAFRKLQVQILEKAIVAMEEVPMKLRDQSSMTMAIDCKQLELAKAKIKKFRRELCDFLQKETKTRDAVYHLGISFYPATTEWKEQEESRT